MSEPTYELYSRQIDEQCRMNAEKYRGDGDAPLHIVCPVIPNELTPVSPDDTIYSSLQLATIIRVGDDYKFESITAR